MIVNFSDFTEDANKNKLLALFGRLKKGELVKGEDFSLYGMQINQVNFNGSYMGDFTSYGCDFTECDFSKSDLYGADFQGTSFEKTSFYAADALKSGFYKCLMKDVNFRKAYLFRAFINRVTFENVCFDDSDLRAACFLGCIFKNCSFDGAKTDNTCFTNCTGLDEKVTQMDGVIIEHEDDFDDDDDGLD